jgi:hypothetical protein
MGEILGDPHQQVAGLPDVETGGEDRLQRFLLLVGGNGGEQFGMTQLDPALVERVLDRLAEASERETAIELGFRPPEPASGFAAIVLAGGKNADRRIGLLGFRSIVAHVVLVDRRLEGLLVSHLADDDGDFALGPKGLERRTVATPPGDDEIAIACLRGGTNEYRLEHSAQPQRYHELVMLSAVEIAARIISGADAGERQRGGGRGRCGDQRGDSRAEAAGTSAGHEPDRRVALRLSPGMRGSS